MNRWSDDGMVRFFAAALFLSLLASTLLWAGQLASDDFNRSDGNPGANWTTLGTLTLFSIRTNEAGNSTNQEEGGTWAAGNFPNDQWSEIAVSTAVASSKWGRIGVVVRGSGSSNTFYGAGMHKGFANNENRRIWKTVSGASTSLATEAIDVANGDVIRLEVQGTSLRMYVNGALRLSANDSDIASGQPGIFLRITGQVGPDPFLDDWSAGDFPSSGGRRRSAVVF